MDKLQISCRVEQGALVVELSGELELTSAGGFDREVSEALTDSGINHVILDCGRLAFVDSSGMGAMVALLRRLRETGGRADLTGVRAGLLELLYITKLEKHFGMFKTVADALAPPADAPPPVAERIRPELRHEPEDTGTEPEEGPSPANEAGAGGLPAYEGMANYPTWYTTQWFLNRGELHQRATEIIKQAEFANAASRALHRLLLQRCDEALKASTMVSGLFGFALGHVVWPEVIAEIRKNPAKSYNKG